MTARSMQLGALLVLAIALNDALALAAHPRVMTQIKKGMYGASLSFKAGRAHPRKDLAAKVKPKKTTSNSTTPVSTVIPTSTGQRTKALWLGQYLMTVNISGILVSATIDTGSGINQVACNGVQAAPGFNVVVYNISAAAPALRLITPVSSPTCQLFCTASSGCLAAPLVPGSCEYEIQYQDNSYVYGRVYSGSLSFPSSSLPVDSSFYFGCGYQASTNPYFFDGSSALFGMDWQPASIWSQLITAGLVNDTMYLCLGDGGDGTGNDQSGVLILGSDNQVSVPYNNTQVVTITMLNPALYYFSYLPTMWLQLIGLSLAPSPSLAYKGSGALIAPAGSGRQQPPLYYVLDSGTSLMYLTPNEYTRFVRAFETMLQQEPVVIAWQCTPNNYGCLVETDRYYTPAQLNLIFPPVLFTFTGASAPVKYMPGNYLIYDYGKAVYNFYIQTNTGSMGVLGNSWLNGWLLQQTRSTFQLKMTRVNSCNDVTY